ncbi:C-C motif chemokine 20b [Syngnathoides biaculeatus]|uniref:C-C motif chemokine 20b n=1 Tax=Syngnathoides biaculeatus TaxID=300417 RepID=UPI002ADE8FE5|nr:C-C motif chemokine 20b [Syngnathoides biaculeatus]
MGGRTVYLLAALVTLTSFAGKTRSASCCLRYIRRQLPCQRISAYTLQSTGKSCDINAVILHLPGRFLCADPAADWTQRVMRCLDERRRKNEEALGRESVDTAKAAAA